MNKSNDFTQEKPEHSSMTTVNILGRLRTATDQVRKVESSLVQHGTSEYAEVLSNVGKELDGKCYFEKFFSTSFGC